MKTSKQQLVMNVLQNIQTYFTQCKKLLTYVVIAYRRIFRGGYKVKSLFSISYRYFSRQFHTLENSNFALVYIQVEMSNHATFSEASWNQDERLSGDIRCSLCLPGLWSWIHDRSSQQILALEVRLWCSCQLQWYGIVLRWTRCKYNLYLFWFNLLYFERINRIIILNPYSEQWLLLSIYIFFKFWSGNLISALYNFTCTCILFLQVSFLHNLTTYCH